MNVLYVLNSTNTSGGATKSFVALLQMMRRQGHSPYVVVPDGEGLCADLKAWGIPVLVLDYRPNLYPYLRSVKDVLLFLPRLLARRWLNARAVRHLTEWMDGNGIDVVHTNVSIIDIGFRAAARKGVPHVYHFREYGDRDFNFHYFPSWRAFHRKFHRPDAYTICITKDIQRHHRLQHSPASRVIYNGIGTKAVVRDGADKDYFLYAGRIEPAKGLLSLLEAYTGYVQAVAEACPLRVAGEISQADYGKQVHDFIAAHHIADKVQLLGVRTDMDVLMQHARAIIIPSRSEAFGRCMAEAMFNGCLVIGRNTGGTQEQFDNGRRLTGQEIGFRYDTEAELTACLTRVAALSAEAAREMTVRAAGVAEHFYSTEAYTSQVLDFYKDIIHEKTD